MLAIGQRLPGEKILGAIGHVRDHLQQHDGFVEMIQIIGGKSGAGVDVGGPQFGGPRGFPGVLGDGSRRICAVFARFCAVLGAVDVIRRSVNVWG